MDKNSKLRRISGSGRMRLPQRIRQHANVLKIPAQTWGGARFTLQLYGKTKEIGKEIVSGGFAEPPRTFGSAQFAPHGYPDKDDPPRSEIAFHVRDHERPALFHGPEADLVPGAHPVQQRSVPDLENHGHGRHVEVPDFLVPDGYLLVFLVDPSDVAPRHIALRHHKGRLFQHLGKREFYGHKE
jgi:hypothetical protein